MSIAYVDSAKAAYTAATATKSITIPATAAAGTFMLLEYVGGTTQPDSSTLSGWTLLTQVTGGTGCFATWWWRIAVSGDAGTSVTVVAATNVKTALTLTVHSGVDTTTPVAVSNTKAETTAVATHAVPTLTLPGGYSGKIIQALALKDTNTAVSGTWTPPVGTMRTTQNSTGVNQAVGVQSSSTSDVAVYNAAQSWSVFAADGTTAVASQHAVTLALALAPAAVVAPTTAGYRGAMTGGNDAQTVAGTTAVLTLPGTAVAGDTAIIIASSNQGAATATAPTGWHEETVKTVAANNDKSYIFSKRLVAADITAATVTITWSTPGRCPASGVVLFGLSSTTPFGTVGYVEGTAASVTAPGVTSAFDNSPILTFTSARVASGTASAATYPTGWTRRSSIATGFTSTSGSTSTGPRFAPVQLAGGGTIQVIDKHPTTGVFIGGSDTQGYYRSTDNGDHWTVVNKGLGADPQKTTWHGCATIAWSITEANTIYAGCGGSGGNGGGFLVGVDNGTEVSWTLRSSTPNFSGNRSSLSDPLPHTDPRSSGNLLAQDGSYIFAATYNNGVLRSSDNGKTWPTTCTMAGAAPGSNKYWARSIAQDPSDSTIVYVAMYGADVTGGGYDGTYGHVWKCTNAHATTPNFTKLTNSPAIAEELKFVGGYLYAAAGGDGIMRSTDGGATWQNLNGTFVGSSITLSGLDGYVEAGGAHVIIASADSPGLNNASKGLIKLSIPSAWTPSSGTITYTALTSNVKYTIPPDNRTWWNKGAGNTLGYGGWANGYVYIDKVALPTVNVYVAGRSGTWRSIAGSGGINYEVANNGEPCFLGRGLACDPKDANHLIFGSTDWNAFEITDGTGYSATTGYRLTGLPWSGQGYGAAFDPVDGTTVIAGSTDKAKNNGGVISYRLPTDPVQTWHDAGYTNTLGGTGAAVATSIVALRNASNQKVIVAACWSGGVWQGIWNGTKYVWAQAAAGQTLCQGVPLTATYEFPIKNVAGSKYVYIWDTNTGVWRSNSYGDVGSWVQVWSATNGDAYASGIALNPATPGEVWVTKSTGLYKLAGVHTGTVTAGTATATKITVPTDAVGREGLTAMSTDGSILYLGLQDAGGGSGMLYSTNSGSTWADAVGDGSLAGPAYQSTKIAVAADDRLYLAGANEVVCGYPVPISGSTTGGVNMSTSIATLNTPGVAGTYGGETVTFSGSPSGEQLFTVATQTGQVATSPHVLYQVRGGAARPVTLAARQGASIVLL